MREQVDVVVVGSGPNGLAAAVTMARAGLQVLVLEGQSTAGGGARTLDLGLAPGIVHDLCSAVHPLAFASPFFAEFDLPARGVRFGNPDLAYAHPLDGGVAGLAYRDLDRTAEALGVDGGAWRDLFGPVLRRWRESAALVLGRRPQGVLGRMAAVGPRVLAGLVARMAEQAGPMWSRRFVGEVAPALLTGVAGHATGRLPSPSAAGSMLLLGTLAHAVGWPVPIGGSGAITGALLADLAAHGGEVRCDTPIEHWSQLPRARAYLFDTSAQGLAQIWGDRMPTSIAKALTRVRPGPGVAKVDFVVSGPVPWTNADVGRAGTVHIGGTRHDMARTETAVAAGRLEPDPFVLLSDPVVADPSREVDGLRPVWAYAHVPSGSGIDPVPLVTARIERYAPGFGDLVVNAQGIAASAMSHHNAAYLGGDIAMGMLTASSLTQRPRMVAQPHRAGIPGVYLCSAAATPGPGVHGMCGAIAAKVALADRFGRTEPVRLALSP